MFHFCTPENIRKQEIFLFFRGYRSGILIENVLIFIRLGKSNRPEHNNKRKKGGKK